MILRGGTDFFFVIRLDLQRFLFLCCATQLYPVLGTQRIFSVCLTSHPGFLIINPGCLQLCSGDAHNYGSNFSMSEPDKSAVNFFSPLRCLGQTVERKRWTDKQHWKLQHLPILHSTKKKNSYRVNKAQFLGSGLSS